MGEANSNSKAEIISKYRTHATDTGSSEVQIALLTSRLETLSQHCKTFSKDKHSRRGMLAIVSRRKRLLEHLRKSDTERYRSIIAALGLRK